MVEPPAGLMAIEVAAAALTVQLSVSVKEPYSVSVTVTFLLPDVYKLTPLVKVWELELKV